MYKIMTAGPTQVRENVRLARSLACTNPDLDPEFYDFYKETCELLSAALHTDNKALILGGEGILGLEAACASLTEPGDRVLVIDNGIFGKGFADFVEIYQGVPVLFTTDHHRPVDPAALDAFLDKDSDFKYATVVHCDTPSGVLNDVETISRILDAHGIMTVADSVAGMFGEPLDLSKSAIDILCGGSRKRFPRLRD
jgi:aspartate aminotransferase-like enzyme